jgi:hypothetical protein
MASIPEDNLIGDNITTTPETRPDVSQGDTSQTETVPPSRVDNTTRITPTNTTTDGTQQDPNMTIQNDRPNEGEAQNWSWWQDLWEAIFSGEEPSNTEEDEKRRIRRPPPDVPDWFKQYPPSWDITGQPDMQDMVSYLSRADIQERIRTFDLTLIGDNNYISLTGISQQIQTDINAHFGNIYEYARTHDVVWRDTFPPMGGESVVAFQSRYVRQHLTDFFQDRNSESYQHFQEMMRQNPELSPIHTATQMLITEAMSSYNIYHYDLTHNMGWNPNTGFYEPNANAIWNATGVRHTRPTPTPPEPTPPPSGGDEPEPTPPPPSGGDEPEPTQPPPSGGDDPEQPPTPPEPELPDDPEQPPTPPDPEQPDDPEEPIRPTPPRPPPNPDMPWDDPSVVPADTEGVVMVDDITRQEDRDDVDEYINEIMEHAGERIEIIKSNIPNTPNYVQYNIQVIDIKGKITETYEIYDTKQQITREQLGGFWRNMAYKGSNLASSDNFYSAISSTLSLGGSVDGKMLLRTTSILPDMLGYTWVGAQLSFGQPKNILDCVACIHDAQYMTQGNFNREADRAFMERINTILEGQPLTGTYIDRDTASIIQYNREQLNQADMEFGRMARDVIAQTGRGVDVYNDIANSKAVKTLGIGLTPQDRSGAPESMSDRMFLYKKIQQYRQELEELRRQPPEKQFEQSKKKRDNAPTEKERQFYNSLIKHIVRRSPRRRQLINLVVRALHRHEEEIEHRTHTETEHQWNQRIQPVFL